MVDRLAIAKRLQADGRWLEAEPVKNQMIKEARQQGMDKEEAQAWAYAEIDRLYPPLPEAEATAASISVRVPGLSDIPESWGELPANTSLQTELSWVQSNRLRVGEELASGATVVRLDRAMSPAPSWAAIGWLETSIRVFSKYCDIVAKAAAKLRKAQEAAEQKQAARPRKKRQAAGTRQGLVVNEGQHR